MVARLGDHAKCADGAQSQAILHGDCYSVGLATELSPMQLGDCRRNSCCRFRRERWL